jgi:molecular chaperone Hsp33
MGKLIRAIAENGSAVCWALDSRDMVGELERIHQSSAVVTAATGRLLTAASIMGSMLKGEKDSVTLRVAGDGPAGSLVAVADALGNAKAYAVNPVVEIPLNQHGKLDVSGAVGKNGNLVVVKDLGLKEPYVGMVPLVSGEIAEDITSYFATSEQIPTVCALGVLVNPDLTVQAAGGFILQMLPGAGEEDISIVEENTRKLPAVTRMLASGLTPEEIAFQALEGLSPQLLDARTVEYRCGCSRQRVRDALLSLNPDELRAMAEEDGKAEVCCHFCTQRYLFSKEELLAMISEKTVDNTPVL